MNKIGADTVVHPERDMGRRIAHNVASASVLDYLELADEHSLVELKVSEKLTGQTIRDLDIRAQFGINIIAIKRGREIIVSPDPNMNIEIGDIMIMIGHDNDLNRFEKNSKIKTRYFLRNTVFYSSFTFIITGKIIGRRAVFSYKYGCNVSMIEDLI